MNGAKREHNIDKVKLELIHSESEAMNMKKFMDAVRKNLFYISLITGMAVLVTLVGLYNAKTSTKEKTVSNVSSEQEEGTKETLSGKDKGNKVDVSGSQVGSDSTENDDENLTADGESSTDGEPDEAGDDTASGESDTTEINTDDYAENTEDNSFDTGEALESAGDELSGTESSIDATKMGLNFNPARDSISWPITGNVIIPYSMDTTVYFRTLDVYKCSPAMVIEAQSGDSVKAVYEAVVTEVSATPEIGNYVRLDMGNGYNVILGQLQEVKVSLGDKVSEGQEIGLVGEPGRFYSMEGTSLYFAIEKDGEPVDPILLID
jgi:hypothetical protein